MNRLQTKTGDIMHVSECNENDVTYGVISINLKNKYSHLNEAEKVLTQFMQQLQPIFAIQHTAGLHVTHDTYDNKLATIDYWQDAEQKDWKVKGWTDGATIAVFYIRNIGRVPVEKEEYLFNRAFFGSK